MRRSTTARRSGATSTRRRSSTGCAGELHLRPCKIGFAAFYESLGRVGLTERIPTRSPCAISGTKVREQLAAGERPDPRIMRPEIADVLIDAYRGAGAA